MKSYTQLLDKALKASDKVLGQTVTYVRASDGLQVEPSPTLKIKYDVERNDDFGQLIDYTTTIKSTNSQFIPITGDTFTDTFGTEFRVQSLFSSQPQKSVFECLKIGTK